MRLALFKYHLNMIDWPIERIRALGDDEVTNLRFNASIRNEHAIVDACIEIQRERIQLRRLKGVRSGRAPAGEKRRAVAPAISEELVASMSEALLRLDDAAGIPEAQERCARQRVAAVFTLEELWRIYLVCAFTSQQRSDDNAPLSIFARSGDPLLELSDVVAEGCNTDWVSSRIARIDRRMPNLRRDIVLRAYPYFIQAGAPGDLLADCCQVDGELKVFCDLARGEVSDADLETSADFSARLDPSPFYGFGPKQLRNVLVNAGLAVNVVPLDSRWSQFYLESANVVLRPWIATPKGYLVAEDLLRRALVRVQPLRHDLANLALMDSIVFRRYERA